MPALHTAARTLECDDTRVAPQILVLLNVNEAFGCVSMLPAVDMTSNSFFVSMARARLNPVCIYSWRR